MNLKPFMRKRHLVHFIDTDAWPYYNKDGTLCGRTLCGVKSNVRPDSWLTGPIIDGVCMRCKASVGEKWK